MQVLLDTHTFLWWIEDDPQLSELARSTIEDEENEIFFSAASGWEIAIKSQIGKLNLNTSENLEQFVATEIYSNDFKVLPIQLSHTLHIHNLPLHHRDPFDRILVAQSVIEKMPILTIDPLIDQYEVETLWKPNASDSDTPTGFVVSG